MQNKHRRVCSTFAAELYNLIDITNLALIILSLFSEVTFGSMSAEQLCDAMESGKSAFPVKSVVDAKSVFDALSANPVKPPEEDHVVASFEVS